MHHFTSRCARMGVPCYTPLKPTFSNPRQPTLAHLVERGTELPAPDAPRSGAVRGAEAVAKVRYEAAACRGLPINR